MAAKILLDRVREFLSEPGGILCCGLSLVLALALVAVAVVSVGRRKDDD